MNNEDNQARDHAIREKIASQMRSIAKAPEKQITAEELQKLKRAASRLDQLLKVAADGNREALRAAAARLDQLLADIRAGKDVNHILKRPR